MTTTISAKRVAFIREGEGLQAGAFEPVENSEGLLGLRFRCPCGCDNESWVNTKPVGPDQGWTFSGTLDNPTLHPSVFNTGMPCRWHGWLRNGEWVSC